MKKTTSFCSIFLLVLFPIGSLLEAQVCVRGKPSPECEFIILTECSYVAGRHGRQITWDLGGIYNLHKHHAIGASFFVNMDQDEDMGSGIKARYRYWLNRSFCLDVAPGLLFTRRYSASDSPIFLGHVALSYRDWIGLIAQVDKVDKVSPENAYTNYSLGIKTGSYAGLAIMGTSAIVLGILIVGLSSMED